MTHDFFKDLKPIQYEGPESNSSLAFRHYNPDEIVLGKRLEEHLRFAVAYWHSFAWEATVGGATFWGWLCDLGEFVPLLACQLDSTLAVWCHLQLFRYIYWSDICSAIRS